MLAQLEQGVIGWSNSSTAMGMLRQLVVILDWSGELGLFFSQ